MEEIVFWHGIEVNRDIEALAEKIAEFNQVNPRFEVKLESYGRQDLAEQVIINSVSNMQADSPDIMWYGPQLTSTLAGKDVLTPVSEFIGREEELLLANIFDSLLESASYDDQLVTLPFDANNLGVVYNQDYFEQAGIEETPDTWEELVATAEKVQRNSEAQYGFLLPYGEQEWTVWVWETFFWQAGGEMILNNKKLNFASQAGVDALKFWSDLKDKHRVADLSQPEKGADPQRLQEGRVAMQIIGSWVLPELEAAEMNYGTFMLPKKERRATGIGGENLYIFGNSEAKKQAAWKFASYFLQDEVQIDFAQQTGYLPVTESAIKSPRYQMFLDENPKYKPFAEQLDHGFIRPTCPEYAEYISPALGKAIRKVLDRVAGPEQALKEAVNQIKDNTRLI